MKVPPFYFKPQTSQRREFRLKRLYYMGSPPFFSSIQGHFEHTTRSMLRQRTSMNDVMTTKIESHGFIYVLFL